MCACVDLGACLRVNSEDGVPVDRYKDGTWAEICETAQKVKREESVVWK